MNQLTANVIKSIKYTIWLPNVVPIPKDGKTRVCVIIEIWTKLVQKIIFSYPTSTLLLIIVPNMIFNFFGNVILSIIKFWWMKKMQGKLLSPLCRKRLIAMPFGLKNMGKTYMREMTTIFCDMIYKEIKIYIDSVIIKSRMQANHM